MVNDAGAWHARCPFTATIPGVILIVIGTASLIWGGFEIPRREQVAEVGPVEVEAETTQEVTIPTWLAVRSGASWRGRAAGRVRTPARVVPAVARPRTTT